MIRAEWTRPMSKDCLPPGTQELACTRKVSDLVTECVWIVNSRQAYVTLEPDATAIKSYRTEFDIKQAFWHRFASSTTEGLTNGEAGEELDCLCLVGEEAIDMYASIDDHYYSCNVPFKITGVHQSSHGLLLERAQRDKKLFTPPPDYFMPRLFSLAHPYDEALPVLCSQKNQSRLVYCWEGDSEVEVVGASSDLVIVFDPLASLHRLYAIRTNEMEENEKPGQGAAQQLATPRINPEHAVTHTPTFTAQLQQQPQQANSRRLPTAHGGGAAGAAGTPCALQQSATRRRMRSLLAGPLASPITPTMNGGAGGGGGGLHGAHAGLPPFHTAKFTPNRSMQSMGESSPFVRLARLPMTSTPRVAGMMAAAGGGGGAAVTPVMQQQQLQQGLGGQLTKGRGGGQSAMGALSTEEDESLISSVWLELLWTEKEPASQKASRFFVSHDMTMVSYVNWQSGEELAVMRVALPSTRRAHSLLCPPGSQPIIIPTAAASYVEGARLTATVSCDQTTIVMYSGNARVAVLVLKMPLASPARFRLICAAEKTMAISTMNGDVLHVRLPPLFRSQFAARVWDTLAEQMGGTQGADRVSRLITAWATLNREKEGEAPDETAALVRFLMEQTGVSVEEMAAEIDQVVDEEASDSAVDLEEEEEGEDVVMSAEGEDEVPSDEQIHGVLARMTNKQRRRVTVRRVQQIVKREREMALVSPRVASPRKAAAGNSQDVAAAGSEEVGEKRKSEEKAGQDTMGAKQSRSEEGIEEDEKWRLICDVLQSSVGAFPMPPFVLKDPLRSAGVHLTSSRDDAMDGGVEGRGGGTRTDLTARTPSPLLAPPTPASVQRGTGESASSAPMSRFYQAAAMCRRAREAAQHETAAAAVKRRKRRVLLTGSAAGTAEEEGKLLGGIANLVFQSLHLAYEESKMHMGEYTVLRVLALHLFIFARWRSLSAYANYYARDFPYLREIQVLSRESPESEELQPLQPLSDGGERGEEESGEAEEEMREERAQVSSWDRCHRTPGAKGGADPRRGGAYGGLLQLRMRAQHGAAAAGGAITPTTASLFTPPTGAARGQVLQPPSTAALAAFSPTVVPSVGEYLCSLLHLAGHTSSMSIYESLLPQMRGRKAEGGLDMAGTSKDRTSLGPNEELLHQLLRDRASGEGGGVAAAAAAVVGGAACSPAMSTPSMFCSPLPPQVSSGSYSLAPPATPLASGLFLAAGVGLGLVRSTGDLVRMLSPQWARRLKLSSQSQTELLEAVNDRDDDEMTRCDRVFSALGWTREAVANLSPALKVLIAVITNRSKPLKPSLFFGKTSQPASLSEYPSTAESNQMLRWRWPNDQRTENVVMMLDSYRPIYIPISTKTPPLHATPGSYDVQAMENETRERQEAFLTAITHRTLAQSFGRAAMHFRMLLPVPANLLHVRELCTSGRSPTTNLAIELPSTDTTKLHREWADFYQGVACGLCAVPAEVMETDSEWLTQAHGQDKPAVMNGLLYAFGLNGHIKALNMFYVHEHLTNQDKMTSIALLLGLSAAYIETGDLQVHKILVTHLPFLMGPTLLEIHVDGLLQTAAVAGLGLLFARSCRTSLIDHLINEMGREQDVETDQPSHDRYSYGLACGFSIGLIGLGRGEEIAVNNVPLRQTMRSIADRLIVLMNGECRADCVFMSSSGDTQNTLGMNGLMPEQLSTTSGLMAAPHHQANPSHHLGMGGLPPPSSHVKEDKDRVNVHITGHGATVALGLMFMKSANRHIAAALTLPNSIFELEGIRPDLVSARIMAKALVEWEEISPTREWVMAQIPPVIRRYESLLIRMNDESFVPKREWKRYWEKIVDRETVAQTYLYCIAGALFALALKFPSTSHTTVARLCHFWVGVLMPSREIDRTNNYWSQSNEREVRVKREGYSRMCRLAGQSCVSDCLNQISLALAVLQAGSGDLHALRVFRALRMGGGGDPVKWARETKSMHAQQFTAHTAMGLLFAGAGRCGLKSDDRSIALLIISLYPISCSHIADNRMYLQPLRFLWSLCLEPRLLYAVSSDGVPTHHPIRYEWNLPNSKRKTKDAEGNLILVEMPNTHREVKPITARVPLILPPLEMLSSVTVGGDAIDCIRFDLSSASDRSSLERILSHQHGRLAYKTVDARSEMADSSLSACGARSLGVVGAVKQPEVRLVGSPTRDPPRRSCDDRWSEKIQLVPEWEKLRAWSAWIQPPPGDPLHLCGEGPVGVRATPEMIDVASRWSLDAGSIEAQPQVIGVYKRLLTEDLSESALAYNEATLLSRILEGKQNVNFNDIRLVSLMAEVISRKVAESRPRSLAPKNYRLKTKDCVDPTLFHIVQ